MKCPVVIKLGGSLFRQVGRIAATIRKTGVPALIVPGGGAYARLVRDTARDDDSAHWMAIAGMEQYGWYISSHNMPVTTELRIPGQPTVFLPYMTMMEKDPLPHRWDVSSDTISAWIAWKLGLPLVLLKSSDGIHVNGTLAGNVQEPVPCQEVDSLFIRFIISHNIRVVVLNGNVDSRIITVLSGKPGIGTVIGATF